MSIVKFLDHRGTENGDEMGKEFGEKEFYASNSTPTKLLGGLMASDPSNPAFDSVMRILSGLSILCSIVVLLLTRVPHHGPEFNAHEVLQIFIVIAQVVVFLIFVTTAVILAGFRGGLRLSRVGAGLSLTALCGLVVELFVMQ